MFSKDYIFHLTKYESYHLTLIVRDNQYKICIWECSRNQIIEYYDTPYLYFSCNITQSFTQFKLTNPKHINLILQYLTFEFMYYHRDELISIYRINSVFNVSEDKNLNRTILTSTAKNLELQNTLGECWIYCRSSQIVSVNLLRCSSKGFITCINDDIIDCENTKFVLNKGQKIRYGDSYITSSMIINTIAKHYYPIILKNISDLNVIPDTLCRIVADYCIICPV